MAPDGTEVEVVALAAEGHSEETAHKDHGDGHASGKSENCHFHAGVE